MGAADYTSSTQQQLFPLPSFSTSQSFPWEPTWKYLLPEQLGQYLT